MEADFYFIIIIMSIHILGSNGVKRGAGPFGTVKSAKAAADLTLPRDLGDARKVIDFGPHADITRLVAQQYADAGVEVLTTDTFGIRRALLDEPLFREILAAHLQITADVANSVSGVDAIFVSIGPPSVHIGTEVEIDCYDTDDLPDGDLGVSQYVTQLEALASLEGLPSKSGSSRFVAMLETVTTRRKLLSALRALKEVPFEANVNLTLTPDGRFLDGDDPVDAIFEAESFLNGTKDRVIYGANCCDHEAADTFFEAIDGQSFAERVRAIALNGANGDPRDFDGCAETGKVHFDPQRPAQIRRLVKRHPSIALVLSCCGFNPERVEALSWALS
jgi:methionine synthase I (cobalamin-dependent)